MIGLVFDELHGDYDTQDWEGSSVAELTAEQRGEALRCVFELAVWSQPQEDWARLAGVLPEAIRRLI